MEVLVDADGHLMGAFGAALLAADAPESQRRPFAWDVDDFEFRTREIVCGRCANHCEVVCVYRDDELIDSWGNRCDRGAVRPRARVAGSPIRVPDVLRCPALSEGPASIEWKTTAQHIGKTVTRSSEKPELKCRKNRDDATLLTTEQERSRNGNR